MSSTVTGPPEAGGSSLFVGRAREIAQIVRALADATSGRGQFVLLMGEPGIGKTRLCDQAASLASRGGLRVLWGRAWEAGGAPAYWPWLEVLAGLARAIDPRALQGALGDSAALICDLVPEIAALLPEPVFATPSPPEEARFRLWRAVVSLVRVVADPGGLALVFDDLHSMDHSSLLLIYALARELRSLRVLLMATCRDVEARLDSETAQLVSRLGREAVVLGLTRFDRETVDELVRRRTGPLDLEIQARLFEGTQGNPLFIEEMLRLLNEEGSASLLAGVLPAGVRDVIRQRLDRVPPDARGLLDLAAVAGDEIVPALLEAASSLEPAWIATQVAQARHAGVFAERAGRTHFSHALVREVLYRELPAERRRALHAVVGRAIEALPRLDTATPLMELAHHAIEGPPQEVARAVAYAVRAASRAMDVTAPDEAVAVLERATLAVQASGNAPPLRAAVLLGLAETRIRRGEVVQGKALCCEVATLARSLGDAALLAGAALTYGRVFTFAVVDPVLVQLLEEGLEAQPPGDSRMRARLLARLAGALQPATNAEEPVRLARAAIAIARRLGDQRTLLETIHDGLSALMDIVDPRERRALNLEVEELATADGDRERLMRTHARLALDHLALGEFVEADARIDAFERLAQELRASWILWRVPLFRAVRAATHGRFAEAESLVEQAGALAARAQDPQAERALILHREGLLRVAERHDEMRALDARARRARASFQNAIPFQEISSALVYTRLEDEEATRAHLDSVVPEDLTPLTENLFILFFMSEPVAYAGSEELAEEIYRLLVPCVGQYVMLGMTQIQWEGPVTRLLALLAARLGRWDEAVIHFEDAMARLRELDARPHLARVQYEFGRALVQRGLAIDADRARALMEAGRAMAEELNMPGLVALAERRLGRARHQPGVAEATTEAPGVSAPPLSLAREGDYWSVTVPPRRSFLLRNSLGLHYLACLLGQPGREFHVLELAAMVGRTGASATASASDDAQAADLGDAGELLDHEARVGYRSRLEDLRDSLAEAESFGDATRAARARAEIDFLAAELSRAVGLGGRARRAGSAAERARSAVQRRIKNALDRIAEEAPDVALVLARAIRTGNFCVYRPP